MKNSKLILGSASPQRKNVMDTMGYPYTVVSADIDEKAIRSDDPVELTLQLAQAKADALIERTSEPAFLITADLVVVYQGKILEKPETPDEARSFLMGYSTHPAQTIVSVVVTNTETNARAAGSDKAMIFFSPIPNTVIEQLIERGEIFGQAGAFSIGDPLVKPFIIKINGDETGIRGLPLALTKKLLQQVGFSL